MKLILLSLLMLVLLGCGEIRLTSSEVGEWVFHNNDNATGWLLNSKTGHLKWCVYVAPPTNDNRPESRCEDVFPNRSTADDPLRLSTPIDPSELTLFMPEENQRRREEAARIDAQSTVVEIPVVN